MRSASKSYSSQFIVLCILIFLNTTNLFGQVIDYTFDNGEVITVEILDQGPDNGYKTAIYLGAIGINGIKTYGIDHYLPGKLFASAMFGPNSYMGEMNYFVYNSVKDITLTQSVLGQTCQSFSYIAEFAAKQRFSIGPHLNVNHLNQMEDEELSWINGNFKFTEITTGITILRARAAKLTSDEGGTRQGSRYTRINSDAVFYTMRDINEASYTETEFRATSTGRDTIVTVSTTDEVLNNVGYRFYLDGKFTAWGSGRFSFKYSLGMQSSPLKAEGLDPKLLFGLGIGYSFNPIKR